MRAPAWVSAPEPNAAALERVAAELLRAARIIRGQEDDAVPFYRENAEPAATAGAM